MGWRAQVSLDEGLNRTIEWYRAFFDGGDARSLTLAQIRRYATLAKDAAK